MKASEALDWLQAKGSESVARIYRRHGVADEPLGVKYSDIATLVKKLGAGTDVAKELWKTGFHEARVVATKVADAVTPQDLETWLAGTRDGALAGALAGLAARLPNASEVAAAWIDRPGEWATTTGWNLYSVLAQEGRLTEKEGEKLLQRIRQSLHEAPNRTRHAMNGTLIAIGGTIASLREAALAAAAKIGRVEVDHGETGCITPDAPTYIAKMWDRAAGKVQGRATHGAMKAPPPPKKAPQQKAAKASGEAKGGKKPAAKKAAPGKKRAPKPRSR